MTMFEADLEMKLVIKDYKNGMSLRAIADKHFSNRTTIRNKLLEAGVYKYSKLSEKISKEKLEVFIDKFTIKEISQLMKIHQSTVYRLIEKYDLKDKKTKQCAIKMRQLDKIKNF